jgi:Uma2 family endonuclease
MGPVADPPLAGAPLADPPLAEPPLLTIEEFAALPEDGVRRELVRGVVRVMSPAHGPAAVVASTIHFLLASHVRPRGLGLALADNAGFALLGAEQTNRSPDVAFIRAERLPPEGIGPGPIRVAPDLAVEVLSPNESASYLREKLATYRAAGTPLVWVVDPAARTVDVEARGTAPRTLGVGETLDGGAVLPEFRCAVAELFEGLAPSVR